MKTVKRVPLTPAERDTVIVSVTPAPPSYPRRNAMPAPMWTDGYGVARTASEMTSEHLWNVIGYIRDNEKRIGSTFNSSQSRLKSHSFYFTAVNELRTQGIL